jgi:hypothetical protein
MRCSERFHNCLTRKLSFSKYCQTAKDGYDVNIHELKAHKIPENIHKEKNNCLKH